VYKYLAGKALQKPERKPASAMTHEKEAQGGLKQYFLETQILRMGGSIFWKTKIN
jgi:hypothetical protein